MSGAESTARRVRGWAPWVVLGLLLTAVLVWAAWPSEPPGAADRAQSIAGEFRCPDCESLSAADAQTASARAIRRDVAERIAAGQSDAQIRQAYIDRYGESILLKPESDGLGLVVWGLPVVLVVVAAAGLVLAFRRWRRAEPLHATPADEALVRDARQDRTS